MNQTNQLDVQALADTRKWAKLLTIAGGIAVVAVLWMVFFYAPTDRAQGVMQRIFYIHVPTAWLGMMAFGIMALCSLLYLWLRDERLDAIALSSAEIGFVFLTATLMAGPLWAKLAWGTWWQWDARLSFSLLLWFIWLGYFALRNSTDDAEQGKRFAAVLAIIGSIDLPVIHLSVNWFRTIHPKPVILNPEGATAEGPMVLTLLCSLLAFTIFFFGLLLYRYQYERMQRVFEFLSAARIRGDHQISRPGESYS
jgi:heme exporter protein C